MRTISDGPDRAPGGAPMTREALEAEARSLGVVFRGNIGTEALAARVEEARGRAEEAKPDTVPCKVLLANLWTSKGKFFARDTVELPRDEAERLESEDKVVIK